MACFSSPSLGFARQSMEMNGTDVPHLLIYPKHLEKDRKPPNKNPKLFFFLALNIRNILLRSPSGPSGPKGPWPGPGVDLCQQRRCIRWAMSPRKGIHMARQKTSKLLINWSAFLQSHHCQEKHWYRNTASEVHAFGQCRELLLRGVHTVPKRG